MENKPASSLVVSLGKSLNRTPPSLGKIGGADTSEMATPERVRIFPPKDSDAIRFLVNGGYTSRIKKNFRRTKSCESNIRNKNINAANHKYKILTSIYILLIIPAVSTTNKNKI